MSLDVIGSSIDECVKDIRVKSDAFRKNLTESNNKERSVGALAEGFSEGVEKAAQNQLPSVKSALIGFSTILARIEYSRKSLYQRLGNVSQQAFVVAARSATDVNKVIKKRSDSFRDISNLTSHPNADVSRVNKARLNAVTDNSAAIQTTRTWLGQFNMELKNTLRTYAHAQMEFAARSLEQWSNFMEDLALLDFNRDADEMVSILEQGSSVQQDKRM